MSGYKPGYSEAHSPAYDRGCESGRSDTERMQRCPPLPPIGPSAGEGAMYARGYRAEFHPEMRHQGCQKCRKAGSK